MSLSTIATEGHLPSSPSLLATEGYLDLAVTGITRETIAFVLKMSRIVNYVLKI